MRDCLQTTFVNYFNFRGFYDISLFSSHDIHIRKFKLIRVQQRKPIEKLGLKIVPDMVCPSRINVEIIVL